METEEGNKLIRKFAGHDALGVRYDYSKDWNGLMEAWKKFFEEVINTEWYEDFYTKESSFELDCMEYSLQSANIQAAFKHFVNLLTWYNQQKKV